MKIHKNHENLGILLLFRPTCGMYYISLGILLISAPHFRPGRVKIINFMEFHEIYINHENS